MGLSRLSPLRQKQIGSRICTGCYIIAERKSGMRALLSLLCVFIIFAARGLAQTTQTAYCDYQDGGEVSIQYNPSVKEEPKNGRVWSPGITLFVQVRLTLPGSETPFGPSAAFLLPHAHTPPLLLIP